MLQSEFFERTNITLTGEEYANVECLYSAVKMDKDEFCKWWLKNRTNKLYQELADAYLMEASNHRADVTNWGRACSDLRNELDEFKAKTSTDIDNTVKALKDAHSEFAKRIIRANCDGDLRVEEVIEQEFSYGFIIKAKREAGIPLSESEIDYMVGKL